MRRLTIDLNNPPRMSPERLAAIDALTPEEIEENARNDPDNPPLTDDELRRLRLARRVQQIRASRGMSQAEFAQVYRIAPTLLGDWERGRAEPDAMAMAYLETIRHEPEAVARALSHKRDAA